MTSLSCFDIKTNLDSLGNDIKNVPDLPVHELADLCKSDTNCKGFNTGGWLKNSIKSDEELTEYDGKLYIKKKTCPHTKQYKQPANTGFGQMKWFIIGFFVIFTLAIILGFAKTVVDAYGISKGIAPANTFGKRGAYINF